MNPIISDEIQKILLNKIKKFRFPITLPSLFLHSGDPESPFPSPHSFRVPPFHMRHPSRPNGGRRKYV